MTSRKGIRNAFVREQIYSATALSHWNPEIWKHLTLYDEDAVLHFLPPGMPQRSLAPGCITRRSSPHFPMPPSRSTSWWGGDRVACLFTMTGTHTGEFNGIPPTASRYVSGISILRFDGGKCVERWNEMDSMGLLQQIGVIPAPQAA